MSSGRFEGKVGVVTGAASGIGAAISERLLAEGAALAAGDIDTDGLKALADKHGGDRIASVRCDVTREDDVEALVNAATDFGPIDFGFNVAGGSGGIGLIPDLSEKDWDFTVDLCLKGVFLCMKHQARAMRAQGSGGAIVNIASVNSRIPYIGGSAYCAAKSGVAMLSQCGAVELAESRIRVNTVSPGYTETPLTSELAEMPGATGALLDRIPWGKAGTPEQMAAASLYLASDDALYISGVNLLVDGAWSLSAFPDTRPWFQTPSDQGG